MTSLFRSEQESDESGGYGDPCTFPQLGADRAAVPTLNFTAESPVADISLPQSMSVPTQSTSQNENAVSASADQQTSSADQQTSIGGYNVSQIHGVHRVGGPVSSGSRRRNPVTVSSKLSGLALLVLSRFSRAAGDELSSRTWVESVSGSFEIVRALCDLRESRELQNDSELIDLLRSYVRAIQSSSRSAEDGITISSDAIALFSTELSDLLVEDMCKMANDAYKFTCETQAMFRDTRWGLRNLLHTMSPNAMNTASPNSSSDWKLQFKLQLLVKLSDYLRSCFSWWDQRKSDLEYLQWVVPSLTRLRSLDNSIRQRWETVNAGFRQYADEVNRISDNHQHTMRVLNNGSAVGGIISLSSPISLDLTTLLRGSSLSGLAAPNGPVSPSDGQFHSAGEPPYSLHGPSYSSAGPSHPPSSTAMPSAMGTTDRSFALVPRAPSASDSSQMSQTTYYSFESEMSSLSDLSYVPFLDHASLAPSIDERSIDE